MNVLEHLRRQLPQASMTTLRQMIRDRRVTVDGEPARTLKDDVPDGAQVQVGPHRSAADRGTRQSAGRRTPAGGASRAAAQLPFTVVHQDRDLIVIDKPAGLLTSSTPYDRRPTAIGILRDALTLRGGRVGLVHRLDKDASGLCVFSLHNEAFASLKRQFADKVARRTYRAIVEGPLPAESGTIDNLLVELVDGTVRPTSDVTRGKRAITHWRKLAVKGPLTLLELRLETGRKHQLRAQFADLGQPIVGDVLYHPQPTQHFPLPGVARQSPAARPRLLLAAVSLGLIHPRTGQPVEFSIPAPATFGDWQMEAPG